MVSRPRHQDKDLEKLLRSMERQGWRVVKRGSGYFKCYCPCDVKHLQTVHLTPSSSGYLRNLVGQLRRATCWREGE